MTSEKTRVILHAEDEPAHTAIVRKAFQLSVANVQLRQVGDGRSALDYLYRREDYEDSVVSPRPDLILLDLRMPFVSGLEVLVMIKNDPDIAGAIGKNHRGDGFTNRCTCCLFGCCSSDEQCEGIQKDTGSQD